MVIQSPVEQFSWNALISNFVGKHDSPGKFKASETTEPKLEMDLKERQSEANEGEPPCDVRDDVDSSQARSCTPFDEPSCVPIDERSCTPRTAAEMKMDLKNIRQDIAEIVKEHQHVSGIAKEERESPNKEKCVHFSLDCNPEAVASKEERQKPVMERKDDTLDYIFNLVEIAICGDKKSNIDEQVTKKPKKKEQMPDPVQLLREKSIFQTLNPGTPSKNRKNSSRSQKSGIKTKSSDKERENSGASTLETTKSEGSPQTSTIEVSKPQVSTTEARELRALRLKAESTISKPEVTTSSHDNSKSEVVEPVVPKKEPLEVNKPEEAVTTSNLVSDVSAVGVPPTILEEASNSQETASSQEAEEEEKKKFIEEVAQAVLAEVQAVTVEADGVASETDESISNAPQSSVHVDVSHDCVSLITDTDDYSHSLPRVIHLSDSESKQTKPAKASNTYSPSIRKLQNRNSVSSALAAYNKKVRRGVKFGGSTRILGKQGSSTTTLAMRNNAGNDQVVQLLAGLLAMGQSGNINAPGTPRGVIFLASVVSFLFWPEDLPKNQLVPKPKPASVEEPAEKKEAPSLLSLVGGKKPKMTSSSTVQRNRPRPQLSSRRMNTSTKKSFDV